MNETPKLSPFGYVVILAAAILMALFVAGVLYFSGGRI